ncbi:hypothetical protein B0O80DRAFT_216286 [Mortierella sp. GBAus27b]|nr:hypothetical protein B0O80DRAFT_216286 [Mortierella sp. GBAus27b]
MGYLSFKCMVLNGTRILGMSFAARSNNEGWGPDHVVLVQSNPNPTSVNDLTWSFVSAWKRTMTEYDVASDTVCHVSQQTGVFTAMSHYTTYDPRYGVKPPRPDYREPGGFQYDPRTGNWDTFGTAQGYRWGDPTTSFALLEPYTTYLTDNVTLYQANIGDGETSINLGMLLTKESLGHDRYEFTDLGTVTMTPDIYGYSLRLFPGRDSIYHLGSIVVDNRTAVYRYTISKLMVQNMSVPVWSADIPGLESCKRSRISAKSFMDMVFVVCATEAKISERPSPTGESRDYILAYYKENITSAPIAFVSSTDLTYIDPPMFLPLGNATHPWVYTDNTQISYNLTTGLWNRTYSGYSPNITEPYGYNFSYDSGFDGYGIIGAVAGTVVLLGIVFFFVRRRYGAKIKAEIWPRWKRKIIAKMIEVLSKQQESQDKNDDKDKDKDMDKDMDKDEDKDDDKDDDLSSRPDSPQDEESKDKIEDDSHESIALQDMGKILVTPDMDVSDLIEDESLAQKQEVEGNQDLSNSVNFHDHPRPTIVTSLSPASAVRYPATPTTAAGSIRDEAEEHSRSSSTWSLIPRAAPMVAPPLHRYQSIPLSDSHSQLSSSSLLPMTTHDIQEKHGHLSPPGTEHHWTATAMETKTAEPPFTEDFTESLRTPASFPIPVAPSAPPLDSAAVEIDSERRPRNDSCSVTMQEQGHEHDDSRV